MAKPEHIDDIYPLTIIVDRYSGSYSGAKYLAFNMYNDCLPSSIGSGDSDEMNFWDSYNDNDKNKRFPIGRSNNPNSAVMDLLKQLIDRNGN